MRPPLTPQLKYKKLPEFGTGTLTKATLLFKAVPVCKSTGWETYTFSPTLLTGTWQTNSTIKNSQLQQIPHHEEQSCHAINQLHPSSLIGNQHEYAGPQYNRTEMDNLLLNCNALKRAASAAETTPLAMIIHQPCTFFGSALWKALRQWILLALDPPTPPRSFKQHMRILSRTRLHPDPRIMIACTLADSTFLILWGPYSSSWQTFLIPSATNPIYDAASVFMDNVHALYCPTLDYQWEPPTDPCPWRIYAPLSETANPILDTPPAPKSTPCPRCRSQTTMLETPTQARRAHNSSDTQTQGTSLACALTICRQELKAPRSAVFTRLDFQSRRWTRLLKIVPNLL